MFYERLNKSCKEAGTTVTALLKELNISTSNGTYWKSGAVPTSEVLIRISEFLNVSTDFLLTGKQDDRTMSESEKELLKNFSAIDDKDKERILGKVELLAELKREQEREAERKRQEELAAKEAEEIAASEAEPLTIRICYFESSVSAGAGNPVDMPHKISIEVDDSPVARMADYAVRIQGDSMSPTYNDGDIIIVKLQDTINIGQVGIFNVNGDAFVKELGDGELISHNPDYENIKLGENDYAVCQGLVLGTV